MEKIYLFLLNNLVEKLGKLKSAKYYGESFATIEIESTDKIYEINICSKYKTQEEKKDD